MDDRPIGVFDSGFGGLTVARALIDLLPQEQLIYLGDTARYPYGDKPPEQVRAYSVEIGRWLVAQGAKMVVVACNTASALSLRRLRTELDVPVVGVIEPGVRAGLSATRNGRVGVIGTVGTVASGTYQDAFAGAGPSISLRCAACPGLVEFVERGETESDQVLILAERLLTPLRAARVDTLVLACTHYPFLARTIGDVMGRDVVLVSPAEETAFEVRSLLANAGLASAGLPPGSGAPAHRWYSSGDSYTFATLGRQLFGEALASVSPVRWQDAGHPSGSYALSSLPTNEGAVRVSVGSAAG